MSSLQSNHCLALTIKCKITHAKDLGTNLNQFYEAHPKKVSLFSIQH